MIKRLLQEHKIISLLIKKYKVNNYSYGYVQDEIRKIAEKDERLLGKIFEKADKKNLGNLYHGILSDLKIVLSKEFLFKHCSCQEGIEYLKNRESNVFTSEQVDEYLKHFLSNADLVALTSAARKMGKKHGKVIIDSVLKLSITEYDLSEIQGIVRNCNMFPSELVDLYISVCDSNLLNKLRNALKYPFGNWAWNLSYEEKEIAYKKITEAEQKLAEIENKKVKKKREKQIKKEAALTEDQKAKQEQKYNAFKIMRFFN